MRIRRQEFIFVGLISLIVILVTLGPIIFGLVITPPTTFFLGNQRINSFDLPVYYSWIEQVRDGHFLFKNLYTGESHPRFILDIFWLSVGLMAKFFNLSAFAAFQLARIILIPILLGLGYLFIAYFFDEEKKRKISLLLLAFSSGWGGFIEIGRLLKLYNLETPIIDTWMAESSTFFTLYHTPHFILSYALMVLIFLLMLYAFEKKKNIYSVGAGLASLVLAQFHPYFVPTVFGVVGLYIVILTIRDKKIRWDLIKHTVILGFLTLPSVLYQLWTLKTFWIRQQHALQNTLSTPPLWNILLAFGALSILTLVGIASLYVKNKKWRDKDIFLFCWLFTTIFLMYAPIFNFHRRLVEGLHIVLVIFSVYGIYFIKEILEQKKITLKDVYWKDKTFLFLLFFPIFSFSLFFVIMRDWNFYESSLQVSFPYGTYVENDKKEAMDWTRYNTPEDSVILSTYFDGNLLPALALRQVYLGHWGMTAGAMKKNALLSWFFSNQAGDKNRREFLKDNCINYIFWGPDEKNDFSSFQPDQASFLKNVFQNKTISLWQVLEN